MCDYQTEDSLNFVFVALGKNNVWLMTCDYLTGLTAFFLLFMVTVQLKCMLPTSDTGLIHICIQLESF